MELPFDAKTTFGEARAPVRGRVNEAEFRSTVAVYGGHSYVGFNKELRERRLGRAVEMLRAGTKHP